MKKLNEELCLLFLLFNQTHLFDKKNLEKNIYENE